MLKNLKRKQKLKDLLYNTILEYYFLNTIFEYKAYYNNNYYNK